MMQIQAVQAGAGAQKDAAAANKSNAEAKGMLNGQR
jgi:hypothetical protein